MRGLGAEEVGRVERGLIHHDRDTFGLHAFLDSLDGARAEVVGVALHGEAVNPDHRHGFTGADNHIS